MATPATCLAAADRVQAGHIKDPEPSHKPVLHSVLSSPAQNGCWLGALLQAGGHSAEPLCSGNAIRCQQASQQAVASCVQEVAAPESAEDSSCGCSCCRPAGAQHMCGRTQAKVELCDVQSQTPQCYLGLKVAPASTKQRRHMARSGWPLVTRII